MRAFVFTDPALTHRAGQFVWLELNFDDARNAAVVERLSCEALPTFYVVNPVDESVVLRVVGSMTVAELGSYFDQGRVAVQGRVPESPLEAALLKADRLDAEGRRTDAASAYRDVLAQAPSGWVPYGRAAVALLYLYQQIENRDDCLAAARVALPRLTGTAAAARVAISGLDCAVAMTKDSPTRSAGVADMERAVRAVLAMPPKDAADDLSASYLSLIAADKDAGDTAGAARDAGAWASFLEAQAEAALTPQQRAVFDSHRLLAYLELGQPQRAVPMLGRSERDLPGDYNPPARLAVAYLQLKKYDDALAASDRALAKVTGPRRLRVLMVRSDVLVAKGDVAGARDVLGQAVAYAESLPRGQRSDEMIGTLRERLGALRAKTPVP